MVRKVGDGFEVLSEAGKHMGKYPTREEADKRLREIEYFKHQNCSEAFMNGTAHGLEYLANAGFDESKHPRDRGGKFGTGMSEAETRKEERKITAYLELKHALKRKSESKKSMSTPDFEKHVAHHESIHGDKSVKYKADHKPLGAFMARKIEAEQALTGLLEFVSNHCDTDPEDITWGHVGDMGYLIEKLREINEHYDREDSL